MLKPGSGPQKDTAISASGPLPSQTEWEANLQAGCSGRRVMTALEPPWSPVGRGGRENSRGPAAPPAVLWLHPGWRQAPASVVCALGSTSGSTVAACSWEHLLRGHSSTAQSLAGNPGWSSEASGVISHSVTHRLGGLGTDLSGP